MISSLFHAYIYAPILWVLVFIYNHASFLDLGIAIVILTILVRIVLLPVFYKSAKDQAVMQKLQPKIKELQERHKSDKEAQAKALVDLYKEHKFNPFAGFIMLLIQLPIFLALFKIFSEELSNVAFASHTMLGLFDLSERSIVLALFAAVLQYIQGKLSIPKQKVQDKSPMASMGNTMILIAPLITLVVLFNLPSALGIYWAVSALFSIIQQIYVNKRVFAVNL